MKIVMIGSGNVATTLCRLLISKGFSIVQVYSSNLEHARRLALITSSAFTNSIHELDVDADVYIIAVSDHVLASEDFQFNLTDRIVVHTAGSVSMSVLSKHSSRYGVLYPLQSLTASLNKLPDIPFFVDGSSEDVKLFLYDLAGKLSDSVELADDVRRSQLHLAAVVLNNFCNFIITQTKDYCDKEGLPFKTLVPLLHHTLDRLAHSEPKHLQTGPAKRNDSGTIAKHEDMLLQYPQLLRIYKLMTVEIRQYYAEMKDVND